jgi:hypothetical protein
MVYAVIVGKIVRAMRRSYDEKYLQRTAFAFGNGEER